MDDLLARFEQSAAAMRAIDENSKSEEEEAFDSGEPPSGSPSSAESEDEVPAMSDTKVDGGADCESPAKEEDVVLPSAAALPLPSAPSAREQARMIMTAARENRSSSSAVAASAAAVTAEPSTDDPPAPSTAAGATPAAPTPAPTAAPMPTNPVDPPAAAAFDAESLYNAHMQKMRLVRGSSASSTAASLPTKQRRKQHKGKKKKGGKKAITKGHRNHRHSVFQQSAPEPRSSTGLAWLQPAYISKRSAGTVARWQRRWFVPSDNYLRYYADEHSNKVLATIDLRHIESVVHRAGCEFELIGARTQMGERSARWGVPIASGGALRLRAASESEAERWTSGLRQRMRYKKSNVAAVRSSSLSSSSRRTSDKAASRDGNDSEGGARRASARRNTKTSPRRKASLSPRQKAPSPRRSASVTEEAALLHGTSPLCLALLEQVEREHDEEEEEEVAGGGGDDTVQEGHRDSEGSGGEGNQSEESSAYTAPPGPAATPSTASSGGRRRKVRRRTSKARKAGGRANGGVKLYARGVEWQASHRKKLERQKEAATKRQLAVQSVGGRKSAEDASKFYERQLRWETHRREEAHSREEAEAEAALSACTFRPKIASHRSDDGGGGRRGGDGGGKAKFNGAKFYERNMRWAETKSANAKKLLVEERRKERRQMPFRPFAMPAVGDENVVPVDRRGPKQSRATPATTRKARGAVDAPLIPPPAEWRARSSAESARAAMENGTSVAAVAPAPGLDFLAALGGNERDAKRAMLALQSEAREQQEFIDEAVAAGGALESCVLMRQVREHVHAIQIITNLQRKQGGGGGRTKKKQKKTEEASSSPMPAAKVKVRKKVPQSPAGALLQTADESQSLMSTLALLKAALGACRSSQR